MKNLVRKLAPFAVFLLAFSFTTIAVATPQQTTAWPFCATQPFPVTSGGVNQVRDPCSDAGPGGSDENEDNCINCCALQCASAGSSAVQACQNCCTYYNYGNPGPHHCSGSAQGN